MSDSNYWIPFSRTHTCGDLTEANTGEAVRLMGWVAKLRDLGGLRFIDLRDRYGSLQLIIDPSDASLDDTTKGLLMEDVIAVEGDVRARPEEMARADTPSGRIEVAVSGNRSMPRTGLVVQYFHFIAKLNILLVTASTRLAR